MALRERTLSDGSGVVRTRREAREVVNARLRGKRGQDALVVELPANWEDLVVERYEAGESRPAIAKGLGAPVRRVYGVLRERGLIRSATEARKLDLAQSRVYALLRERGVLRTPSQASATREERRRILSSLAQGPEALPGELKAAAVEH